MKDMMKQKPILIGGGVVIVLLILVLVFAKKPASTTDGMISPTMMPTSAVVPTNTEATDGAEMESDDFASVMNKLWQWDNTLMSDGTKTTAITPSKYTIKFVADNLYEVQADCNRGSGTYTQEGNKLTLGPMAMTMMACVGDTQDQAFLQGLNNVDAYLTKEGKLFLTLKLDSGTMQFSPAQ